jgi:hypothetical protein
MTYADARRALGLSGVEQYGEIVAADAIKGAFKREAFKLDHATGTAYNGGPTLDQLKEARTLLLHAIGEDCPTCAGLTFVKTLGSIKKCPTCGGTGRVSK